MAASPSSSPRLPSPPPIAEDQLGPKSPIAAPNEGGELGRNPFEANASRRIRPGTKAADMALGPPLVPLTDIDSPFQLTEHLKALHNAALHRTNPTTISPIDRATALRLANPPEGVDKYLWLYELCRLLCKEINAMIVALFSDDPPCSAQTCNEMRASEWQYLCAVHDPPKPCCAIDYCCHTLDWTNSVLTSQKNFPSRMALGGEGKEGGSSSGHGQLRQLTNIFRRVYRIFAHAWFQHREMYWKVELKSGLYVFFKTVCDVYNLIPEDNYTVPPEAEGIEPPPPSEKKAEAKPSIMKREKDNSGMDHEPTKDEKEAHLKAPVADGSKTKRHRHTPSVGSESITTVMEDPEEDEDKMEETIILSSEPPAYSADESTEPGPVVESLAPAEDPAPASEVEAVDAPTSTEMPVVSVEEASSPAKEETAPLTETEETKPEDKSEAQEAGKTPASSAASDISTTSTASTESWQVLTDEAQQPETPASSTTEGEAHPEAPLEAEKAESNEEDASDSETKQHTSMQNLTPANEQTKEEAEEVKDVETVETLGADETSKEKSSKVDPDVEVPEAKEEEAAKAGSTAEDAKDEAKIEPSSPAKDKAEAKQDEEEKVEEKAS